MTKPYRLGLYEKSMPNGLALSKKLLLTRESGFDYLELSIDETDEKLARLDWDEETLAAGKQHARNGRAHPFHLPVRPPQIPHGPS